MAAETEERFRRIIARELRSASQAGQIELTSAGVTATEAAELLTRAMSGLKGPGLTLADQRKRLATLLGVMLAGLGTDGSLAKEEKSRRPPLNSAAEPVTARAGKLLAM